MIVGCAILGAVCYVWITDHTIDISGIALAVVGILVISLPFLDNFKFNVSKDGMKTAVKMNNALSMEMSNKNVQSCKKEKIPEVTVVTEHKEKDFVFDDYDVTECPNPNQNTKQEKETVLM